MSRARRGIALLAALVLLTLSAALAAATFSAARSMRRAALTTRARARVESGVSRAFAEVLAQWSPALDTIAVGAAVNVALRGEPATAGPPLLRTARVERVASGVYAVTVDLRAFGEDHPLARRRARLWLERLTPAAGAGDSSGVSTSPSVVTPWGFADLY